jgi:acetylornithine/LysW-gamma-L-lysine aminotransferase
VSPDILTAAKGIASGLPLGATVCADWIAEADPEHGSTFSGGPVVCAAANATLDVVVEEDLPTRAADVGRYLMESVEDADLPIREVRGQGLMIGLEVKRGSNRLLRDLALNEQVLALPAGRTVLRLLPPLIVGEEHADRFVDALEAVLG